MSGRGGSRPRGTPTGRLKRSRIAAAGLVDAVVAAAPEVPQVQMAAKAWQRALWGVLWVVVAR